MSTLNFIENMPPGKKVEHPPSTTFSPLKNSLKIHGLYIGFGDWNIFTVKYLLSCWQIYSNNVRQKYFAAYLTVLSCLDTVKIFQSPKPI